MSENKNPIFNIKDFEIRYPSTRNSLVYEVDFPIFENEFILFTGKSGVGKSTLFLLLKGILSKIYSCEVSGKIFYKDINILENYPDFLDKKIGYLGQNPYAQIVTQDVIDELVFGMENFKFDKEKINKNAVNYSNLFNLTEKLDKKTKTLSGGYCQRLNLASILSYEPDIILLDEPVSFLDENSAKAFYEIIKEFKGKKTIIIIEHFFEDILNIVDRVLVFKNKFEQKQESENIISRLENKQIDIANVYFKENKKNEYNLNDEKEKLFLNKNLSKYKENSSNQTIAKNLSLISEDLYFRYNKDNPFLFENLNFNFQSGKIIGIVGKNGIGKSSLLNLMVNITKPTKGRIYIKENGKIVKNLFNHISILFQNSESIFFFPFVKDEISNEIKKNSNIPDFIFDALFSDFFDLSKLYNRSSFTLSEGEKRRLGFLILLLLNKPIKLYDEPTYAQDRLRVDMMKEIIKKCKDKGDLQIIVSHDIEFINEISDEKYKIEDKKLIPF